MTVDPGALELGTDARTDVEGGRAPRGLRDGLGHERADLLAHCARAPRSRTPQTCGPIQAYPVEAPMLDASRPTVRGGDVESRARAPGVHDADDTGATVGQHHRDAVGHADHQAEPSRGS